MENKILNEQSKMSSQESGDYVVVINSISPGSLISDVDVRGTIVLTEGKSLDRAVAIGLGLKQVLPSNSLVYVVNRDCLSVYLTSYTCLFEF